MMSVVVRYVEIVQCSDVFSGWLELLWEYVGFFFLMIRRPPRSTQSRSSAASDVYKRQTYGFASSTGKLKGKILRIRKNESTKNIYSPALPACLLYTSPSPRDSWASRMPSSAWKKKNIKNSTTRLYTYINQNISMHPQPTHTLPITLSFYLLHP